MGYSTKNTSKARLDSFFAKVDNEIAEHAKRKAEWAAAKKGKKKDKKDEAVSD